MIIVYESYLLGPNIHTCIHVIPLRLKKKCIQNIKKVKPVPPAIVVVVVVISSTIVVISSAIVVVSSAIVVVSHTTVVGPSGAVQSEYKYFILSLS